MHKDLHQLNNNITLLRGLVVKSRKVNLFGRN